jgi:uncharacterized protein YjlB
MKIKGKLSAGKPHEWDLHISTAIFTQRIHVHTKTKTTAAELMFGQKLRLRGDPEPVLNPVYGDHTNFRFLELEVLAANRYEQYLKYGDKQSAEVHYKIGDKVLLLAGELRKGAHTVTLISWTLCIPGPSL